MNFMMKKSFNALNQCQIMRKDSIQAIGFTVCDKNKIAFRLFQEKNLFVLFAENKNYS